jgi:sodium-coupled neutral amino acid transporter 7/8
VVGFAKSGIRKGSVASGVFTLVASAMGAGCLSLPHMFKESGIGLGLILLACGALLAHIGLVVLMSCARYTDCRSFAELVSLSLGGSDGRGPGRSRSVDMVIALYGLAAVLIYMMLIGDFFEGIAHSAVVGYSGMSRQTLILSSLLLVFPLSVPKSVTALRYISILSTASIAFMTVVVMLKTPGFLRAPEASGYMRWFRGDTCSTLRSFSMALFAFSAHTNAVPVATALDHPRASVIWRVSLISVLIELAIYSLIAACGYLSFLDDTKQDFIRNYSDDDRVMFIVRCVYAVPVVLGVPINLSPAVGSMKALAQGAFGMASLPSTTFTSCTRGGILSSGLIGKIQHVAIIIAVLGVCTTLAIWCEAIADVIALFGSCFGTLICLVWPCRIYHAVFGKLHPRRIGVLVGNALLFATLIGVLSFALQASDFTRGTLGGFTATN